LSFSAEAKEARAAATARVNFIFFVGWLLNFVETFELSSFVSRERGLLKVDLIVKISLGLYSGQRRCEFTLPLTEPPINIFHVAAKCELSEAMDGRAVHPVL
jgi:hypothetical protein